MSRIAVIAEWSGFTAWLLLGWALANRLVMIAARWEDERRRWRNARRLRRWQPRARPRDTAHDATTVMPAIGRPRAPGGERIEQRARPSPPGPADLSASRGDGKT